MILSVMNLIQIFMIQEGLVSIDCRLKTIADCVKTQFLDRPSFSDSDHLL